MFSQTAYEAFYTYIGLYLHEASIQLITSQEVLAGLLLIIFATIFFIATWRYFGKYMPGFALGKSRKVGLGVFVKVLASFLLGVAILKVDSPIGIKNPKRVTWHENKYIQGKIPHVEESYKVSFIFDLFTRSAEEIAQLANVIVDKLFKKTNSELEAPAAFYRAILYTGTLTIEDPDLRGLIDLYTERCFNEVIPMIGNAKKSDKLSEFFRDNGVVDQELRAIPVETEGGDTITCLDLKDRVKSTLYEYSRRKKDRFTQPYADKITKYFVSDSPNMEASSALVNYYLSKTESTNLGIQKGAEVPGGFASFALGWKRFFSWDGFLGMIGKKELSGAVLTAERAKSFSEYLQRAPHIKGMVKLFLIALFPWLVFFLFAGKWKILVSWYAVYVSVLLWTPIWTLLYHLMTSIALSAETMEAFGRLNDGISLYSSQLVSSRLYQFYAIYSWLQLILGPLPTVLLAWGMFGSFLKDNQEEGAPEAVNAGKAAALTAATGGGAAGAAKAGVRTAV